MLALNYQTGQIHMGNGGTLVSTRRRNQDNMWDRKTKHKTAISSMKRTSSATSSLFIMSVLCLLLAVIPGINCIDAPPLEPPVSPPPTLAPPPTFSPSKAPTKEPTPAPVPTSPAPTDSPTIGPSSEPTAAPTKQPTATPSKAPSKNPTAVPTTATPTMTPSMVPTVSSHPSELPTDLPSFVPSERPSEVPSLSLRPSVVASDPPSDVPTAAPSFNPTDFRFPLRRLTLEGSVLTLVGLTATLDGTSFGILEKAITNSIFEQAENDLDGDYEELLVIVTIVSTEPFGVRRRRQLVLSQEPQQLRRVTADNAAEVVVDEVRRRLQEGEDEEESGLKVIFTTNVFVRAKKEEIDLRSIVDRSFDTNQKQIDLMRDLRDLDEDTFKYVESTSVMTVDQQDDGPPKATSTANAGVITGICLAGAALIGVLGYIAYTRYYRGGGMGKNGKRAVKKNASLNPPLLSGKRSNHGGNNKGDERAPLSKVDSSDEPGGNEYASEIDVDSKYEISTLGDPIPPHMYEGQSITGDSSLGGDYDFAKAYGGIGAPIEGEFSLPSRSTTPTNSLAPHELNAVMMTKDDATLDAQYKDSTNSTVDTSEMFDVDAPPGMLGLVLETSADGVPIVHAVKSSSALVNQIKIGDRLHKVDGEDVTVMLASDVSRLIASKRDNPVRQMTFSRPNAPQPNVSRTPSADQGGG